jgi:hypothetical protein
MQKCNAQNSFNAIIYLIVNQALPFILPCLPVILSDEGAAAHLL